MPKKNGFFSKFLMRFPEKHRFLIMAAMYLVVIVIGVFILYEMDVYRDAIVALLNGDEDMYHLIEETIASIFAMIALFGAIYIFVPPALMLMAMVLSMSKKGKDYVDKNFEIRR
ncbi:hypothetical protein HQ524_04080 [Candidatus Uhrbacteria bacterium]|nr:hypothetical protein [Candidatus Uhrbacteria bacterium]